MYSICNIVCGYSIPNNVRDYIDECDGDYEACGFESFYHGSANVRPIYVGKVIGRFDECENIKASELIAKLTASEQQIAVATAIIFETKLAFAAYMDDKETSDKEKKLLLDSIPDKPEVVLIWSTS